MTQQLVVLAQELDGFIALGDDSVALFQCHGVLSAFRENHSSQCCWIVGKFQEGRIIHDVDTTYVTSGKKLQRFYFVAQDTSRITVADSLSPASRPSPHRVLRR